MGQYQEKEISHHCKYEREMLENMYSNHTTTLAEAETEHTAVDPTGVLAVEDEYYQVNVAMPSMDLLDEQIWLPKCSKIR